MVKEADQDAKLSRRSPPGRASAGTGPSTRSKTKRGGASSGRGRGNRGGRRYISSFLVVPPTELYLPPPQLNPSQIGGRLKNFHLAWRSFTSDRWVLNTVSKGLEIVFISTPYQETIPPDIHMSGEMEQVCENEVTSLLLKGAVTETSDTDGFFSALFVIPKKSGGFRPIVNLKGLNSFVCYEHFKMERLDSVKFLLKKGDWLVKLDLKDAYLLVPILPNHQKFLRFRWKGRHFQFRCLPFGLSSAP